MSHYNQGGGGGHQQHYPQNNGGGGGGPSLGATFVPGGFDDFYMPPEVVAPAPQRVMPEVPQNMQNDLQRMELEAGSISTPASPPISANGGPSYQSMTSPGVPHHSQQLSHRSTMNAGPEDLPTFSPFPKVKGENVPPNDDELEGILWNQKDSVLNSQDVQRQIDWSKDVLTWVDTCAEAAKREPLDPVRSSTPRIEHELRIAAVNIINYLADQGHPEGLFIRAKWYEFGKFGMRLDKREAFNGYRAASELGFVRSEYRMGMFYESSLDMAKAIEHYQRGLSAGDSASAYRMGMMSLLGQHGQIMNYQRGIDLVNQAADTSDEDAPQGSYVFGMLIARELPDINLPESLLPMDFGRAKWYIERASQLGFAKAQLKMGQAYELCQMGCDFNPSLSLHYYALAAKQNLPEACLGVSRWFLFGYDGFFAKNEKLAYKYALEAANAKLSTGQFAVGYYSEIGIHVPKDVREARKWYELAADNGNKDAIGRLDSLNQQKTLTKQDHETVALSRIKSQHGSMRGKRPERFKQTGAAPMPVVAEDGPRVMTGTPQQDNITMPDPSRLNLNDSRPPAFTVNLQGHQNGPPGGPAAPYPEDDVYNSNGRGLVADQPASAFGIRPQTASPGLMGPGGRPMQTIPGPQMQMGRGGLRLGPNGPMMGGPGPGQGLQQQQQNFRQSSGPPPMGMNNNGMGGNYPPQRPMSAQPPGQYGPGPGGPGPNQRPLVSPNQMYQGPGLRSPLPQNNINNAQRPPPNGNFGPRMTGASGGPGGPGGPRPGSAAPPGQGRGGMMGPGPNGPGGYVDHPGRVGSAPPGQQRPGTGPPSPMNAAGRRPSPATQTPMQMPPAQVPMQSTPPKPAKSSSSSSSLSSSSAQPPKGPATFEEMGIPQGKTDGDCVVM